MPISNLKLLCEYMFESFSMWFGRDERRRKKTILDRPEFYDHFSAYQKNILQLCYQASTFSNYDLIFLSLSFNIVENKSLIHIQKNTTEIIPINHDLLNIDSFMIRKTYIMWIYHLKCIFHVTVPSSTCMHKCIDSNDINSQPEKFHPVSIRCHPLHSMIYAIILIFIIFMDISI